MSDRDSDPDEGGDPDTDTDDGTDLADEGTGLEGGADGGSRPGADSDGDGGSDADSETDLDVDAGADSDGDVSSGGPFQRPGEVDDEESRVITYGVPFVAALLVAVGIAGVTLGGWAMVQPAVGGCGNPVISVSTAAETDQRLENEAWADSVDRLEFEALGPAEQRAFAEAVESPRREATVDGDFEHRAAFRRGVVVTRDDTDRYATVVSMNECLSVDPLVLPLGIVALLVGFVAFAYLWYRFGTRPPDDWDVRF